jgi:hypothetical protein
VRGDATANGTPVQIWTCNDGNNQGWQLTPQGTLEGLDGKCLTVAGGNFANHTAVQISDCTAVPAQQWTWAADGTLRIGGKCLDIPGADPTPGNALQIYDCLPTQSNQQWVIHGATPLRSQTGGCFDVPNGSLYNGAPINYYECHGAPFQNWVHTPQGLLRADDGECVQANGGAGSALTIGTCTGAPNQVWQSSGYPLYQLFPSSAPWLCITASNAVNGSPLVLSPCGNSPYQRWETDTVLTVALIPQSQDKWCWAATGEMIMGYMGLDVPQCVQANQQFNRTDCCSNPKACDSPGDLMLALNGFVYNSNYYGLRLGYQSPVSFNGLASEIANHRPVAFAWSWQSGGGHAMVVIGATIRDGTQWVTINDPLDVNIGDQADITYSTWVSVPGDHSHAEDWWDIQRTP